MVKNINIIKKKNMRFKIIIIILLGIGLLTIYPVMYKFSDETIKIVVKEKERITTGSSQNISSKFLVYTEGEVFENTDSILYFKFNSSDFQNKLDVGKTYRVTVAGWRVPFMSMYRNVVEIKD